VEALPPATRYILRGGQDVMTAASKALGLAISQTACVAATANAPAVSGTQAALGTPDATSNGSLAALWLGPDEQLLLGPAGCDIASALEPALRDLPHSLVEVSHRQTALQVSGPQATLLLNTGCPLDLDPSTFPVGMCTRTVLAKAEIILWRTDQNVFHVEVWRSFADYVSSFLAEVARELEP
jgi:sarcosine oxidase subunit gamma